MTTSPSCPISYGQPIPGERPFQRGDPWSPQHSLQDLINSIPTAHDLRSAINALHRMNNIIMRLNRGEPMINNVRLPREPDITIPGYNFKPNYEKTNWVIEGSGFERQTVYNPDDRSQSVDIKTISYVSFFNENTSYRLTYYSNIA